jgi:recombination protein RecT
VTTQTVTGAVAKRDQGPAELVRQSRSWFATIVPSHIDVAAFVALTIGYLRRNPKLAAAATRNPQSFMAALSECARLGLVPGDTFHCVPFEDRRNGTVEITGIVDYTGEIELIYRAGAVASVKAEIVCDKDHFHFTTDMDRPEHAPNWFGDRGDLIGAYAYAVMKDGATSKVIIYSKAEIDRVKAVAKGTDRDDSPWKKWYDRMALKTVIHRLEHFVPTSAEYRREQLRAAAEIAQQVNSTTTGAAAVSAPPVSQADDITDAEIVDEPSGPAVPDETPGSGPAAGPETQPSRPRGRRRTRPADTASDRQPGPALGEQIGAEFDRLGIDLHDERTEYVTRMTGGGQLDEDTLSRVLADLKGCDDTAQLQALITGGDKPGASDA